MKSENILPIMLYDGDCGFCQYWIDKWKRVTGEFVRYELYLRVLKDYPQVSQEECRKRVQLIMPDGSIFQGAHAVLKALSLAEKNSWLLRSYEAFPDFGNICELFYQLVASSRSFLSRLYRRPVCRIQPLKK